MWSFLARPRERKLAHWAMPYLAGAWLLLQVLDLHAQPFTWPDLVLMAGTVLLAIGFLAVVVVACYHGKKGVQLVSGVELLMLAAVPAPIGTGSREWKGGQQGVVRDVF